MRKYMVWLGLFLTVALAMQVQASIGVEDYTLIDAKPGEKVESSVTVNNPGDEPIKVEVWKQDWTTKSVDGKIRKKVVEKGKRISRSLAPYITFKSSTSFTVPANREKEFHFTTKPPKDASGSYWSAIAFTYTKKTEKDQQEGVTIKTRMSFLSKVIRFDSSSEKVKPWINSLSKKQEGQNLQFEAVLENRGETPFFLPCTLKIFKGLIFSDDIKKKDRKVAKLESGGEATSKFPPFYFFPEQKINIKFSLPGTLEPGYYTAKVLIPATEGDYRPVAFQEFEVEGG